MDELRDAVQAVAKARPARVVLSAPRAGQALRRATVLPYAGGWQVERLSATQAFHENIPDAALAETLLGLLHEHFTQLTALAEDTEHRLRITKKGKVLRGKGPAAVPAGQADAARPHDRNKKLPYPEGEPIAPLVDIGVFTAEGKVVAAKRDKHRQINRFIQLVEDALKGDVPQKLRVVDFGCGKSALSFVLYHYLTQRRGLDVEMCGLDLREDVVAACAVAAQKYGYTGLHFEVGDIADYAGAARADMVVSLHACDTATDLALAKAVGWDAQWVFCVPCCQHEANDQMQSDALSILTRYGIVQERTAALMTDAVRANLMTACGYKTQLVEFVGFEHTPKNIMIRARKAKLPAAMRQKALDEVKSLAEAFHLQPCLMNLLLAQGRLK